MKYSRVQNSPPADLSRRGFISGLPFLLAALPQATGSRDTAGLSRLSAGQSEAIERSTMARDLANYFGKGYSCAESGLMTGLNYLEKPRELVWIACGFGGGILHRDLCGFLTAGVMVLGLAAGEKDGDRRNLKKWCAGRVRDFWAWWQEQAPLRCSRIRSRTSSPQICRNLGLLSVARIQFLIESETE